MSTTRTSDYAQYNIPEKILKFFSEEKGLSPELLLKDQYDGSRKAHYVCYHLDERHFPLIRFYRDTPGLSVETLLFSYDSISTRHFAVFDTEFRFHKWLLKHGLTMPEALIKLGLGNKLHNISSLCNASGIEYLNRVVLSLPKSEWQKKLNEIASGDKSLESEKRTALADVLLPVSWSTLVEYQFLEYQKQEKSIAARYSSQGMDSLFWSCVKKLSKEPISDTEFAKLPENVQNGIIDAKPFFK